MTIDLVRLRKVLSISLPIMAGMTSQNILNLVDTVMVGRLGAVSLSAVGIGGVAGFLAISLFLGLSPGVQAIAARRKGEGKDSETAFSLNAGILLAVLAGVPFAFILYRMAPSFLPFLNGDERVVAEGIPYLQMRILGVVGIGINFSFRGYWNGINKAKCYMMTLALMNAINVLFNYMFIFGNWGMPRMGAAGAGLASTLATYCGSVLYFYLGARMARPNGFMHSFPSPSNMVALLRLSLPSGTQQFFYAGGMTALFTIIGKVGTYELAASNVIVNLMLVGILPGIGFGMAATSLVGQALGRKDPDDAYKWGWDVTKVGFITLALIGLPLVLQPYWLLRAFTPDVNVIAVGMTPLRIAGAIMGVQAVSLVMLHALMGAGDNKRVMLISIACQWGVLLPGAYVVGPVCGHGLTAIWFVQIAYRAVLASLFATFWIKGAWRKIEV
ncbi:MAG: MATE family efflux transporter [Kiritimatiellia bacterium]|jgi:putative MATE family efflux protein|nr:MATE family efflux transporter [Kiritimatiellia bacterium]MDP6848530.1 MATE family efflux transporter [Kiritimatiellia bacterium]